MTLSLLASEFVSWISSFVFVIPAILYLQEHFSWKQRIKLIFAMFG